MTYTNDENKKIQDEINSYFNEPSKFLVVTPKLIIGQKNNYEQITPVIDMSTFDYNKKKSKNNQINNSLSKQPDISIKSSYASHLEKNYQTKNELVDKTQIKSIFESFKDPASKCSFISSNKINENHFNLIPKQLENNLNKQEINIKKRKSYELFSEKLCKSISKKVQKPKSDILMNSKSLGAFRLKVQILNNIEDKKLNDDVFNRYKWYMSLRRPENFIGKRNVLVNLRPENKPYWGFIREKSPKISEITLKPECDINNEQMSSFLNNPYLIKNNKKDIKKVENFENLHVEGKNLYDIEYNNAMKMKGKALRKRIFCYNGKNILDKNLNEVFGNELIYKNYKNSKKMNRCNSCLNDCKNFSNLY